jgi:hypothetical protein
VIEPVEQKLSITQERNDGKNGCASIDAACGMVLAGNELPGRKVTAALGRR